MTDRWTCPPELPPDAAAWWPEIVAELRARGREADALPLHARILAQLLSQYEKATQFINREGMVLEIRNDKGELKRQEPAPEFRIQQQLVDKIVRLAKVLGLEERRDESGEQRADDPRNRLRELLAGIAHG